MHSSNMYKGILQSVCLRWHNHATYIQLKLVSLVITGPSKSGHINGMAEVDIMYVCVT